MKQPVHTEGLKVLENLNSMITPGPSPHDPTFGVAGPTKSLGICSRGDNAEMPRDADVVYGLLLAYPYTRQRAMSLEQLLSDHPNLKPLDFRAALAVLAEERKVILTRSARGDSLGIYSGLQDCYKMYYQIEVFVRTAGKGFKAHIFIRHTVTPNKLGSYLKDLPGEYGRSPEEIYASADEAFRAGVALAKSVVDEKYTA